MSRILIRGIALDKLLIAIMAVSVFSTAIWNYQLKNSETWADPMLDSRAEERIKSTLDDIKYHLKLAGYEYVSHPEVVSIESENQSDIIRISHNGIHVEYKIDNEHNLIRSMETAEKTMAENVSSMRFMEAGPNTIVVTITRAPFSQGHRDEIETLSKSYSIVVEMNSLL